MAIQVSAGVREARPWAAWMPVLAGLALLYVPTYLDLYREFWNLRQQSAAPVILLLVGWLCWRERDAFVAVGVFDARRLGVGLFSVGLLLYILGRSQSFYQVEVISQIPLLLGVVAILLGRAGLPRLWFPIALLICLVPVPGSILDRVLLPLKECVSDVVDDALYLAGYPIARSGSILSIGPYQLLVADACSGLNSMLALSGVGLFYVYLSRHLRAWVRAALLVSILPIAFIVNVARVAALVLITYYAGEGAGVRFHDWAGYVEIALAFGSFFAVERLLVWIDRRWPPSRKSVRAGGLVAG